MKKDNKKESGFHKIVSEKFPINPRKGGGILKIEAWENYKGKIVKYSIAYINHHIFSGDNGRVIGYDNSHCIGGGQTLIWINNDARWMGDLCPGVRPQRDCRPGRDNPEIE
jgi:hypothetical protein